MTFDSLNASKKLKDTKDVWIKQCKESIKNAGLEKKVSTYNGKIGKWVFDLCKTFQKQYKEHNSMSAECVSRLFTHLVINDGFLPSENRRKKFKK